MGIAWKPFVKIFCIFKLPFASFFNNKSSSISTNAFHCLQMRTRGSIGIDIEYVPKHSTSVRSEIIQLVVFTDKSTPTSYQCYRTPCKTPWKNLLALKPFPILYCTVEGFVAAFPHFTVLSTEGEGDFSSFVVLFNIQKPPPCLLPAAFRMKWLHSTGLSELKSLRPPISIVDASRM